MTPEIGIVIAQLLLKYGPALAREVSSIFAKDTVTHADWEKVFSMAEKSYEDYVTKG